MRILFLDQTGKLAGAERVLLDLVFNYKHNCLVGLFEDGPFRDLLEVNQIPVRVLSSSPMEVRRESNLFAGIISLRQLVPLILKVVKLSRDVDLVYVNTPKALVVGALASAISRRPLVYHLHDILVPEHFSQTNQKLMVGLSNIFADQVIAVSEAAKNAFVNSGGREDNITVVYNGFDSSKFSGHREAGINIKRELRLDENFVVGHFSRFSPWKGQHILIESLLYCNDNVKVILVGNALFGEEDYAQSLREKVKSHSLEDRVMFLGFRNDVPQLMSVCDVITHTSIAPEPCARVLIEAMLSGKPLVASKDGGTIEIIEDQVTGWLVTPGNAQELAKVISFIQQNPSSSQNVAALGREYSAKKFTLDVARQQVDEILQLAYSGRS